MLKSFTVQKFKSIQDQTLDLGQLNVIIGTNGSGKSNLLEAFGMYSMAVEGRITYQGMSARGMRLSTPEVFKSAFAGNRRSMNFHLGGVFGVPDGLTYSVDVTSKKDEPEATAWGFHQERLKTAKPKRRLAFRNNSGVKLEGVDTPKPLKREEGILQRAEALGVLSDVHAKALSAVKQYAIYAPSTLILRGVDEDRSHKSPLGLYGGNMAATANSWIDTSPKNNLFANSRKNARTIFLELIDWATYITVATPELELQASHVHTGSLVLTFKDRFMLEKFKSLYAYDVSEGALYVLFVLMLLLHPETPPVLALDNVDSSLNPGLIRNLMVKIAGILDQQPERQIFLTTHNPTALDGLDLFHPQHRLFVAKRHPQHGYTQFERVQPPPGMTRDQWGEQHGEMKLSEIWLSGALGGVAPPLGM
ncbi:MAG: AAA family ATPase [Magnetococcales bacterium]|nr:AAA family ATPase [Magnetococcales bacterium]